MIVLLRKILLQLFQAPVPVYILHPQHPFAHPISSLNQYDNIIPVRFRAREDLNHISLPKELIPICTNFNGKSLYPCRWIGCTHTLVQNKASQCTHVWQEHLKMAMECRVCGGQWWLVPKWAKHFGEPILAYSDTRFPSLKSQLWMKQPPMP